ncbi:MAG: hypothetical protein ACYC1C_05830 [Chloroflexota bacterium]
MSHSSLLCQLPALAAARRPPSVALFDLVLFPILFVRQVVLRVVGLQGPFGLFFGLFLGDGLGFFLPFFPFLFFLFFGDGGGGLGLFFFLFLDFCLFTLFRRDEGFGFSLRPLGRRGGHGLGPAGGQARAMAVAAGG